LPRAIVANETIALLTSPKTTAIVANETIAETWNREVPEGAQATAVPRDRFSTRA
jgi:hypothetical protein